MKPPSTTASHGTQKVAWGRKNSAGVADGIAALLLVLICPVWVYVNWIALSRYGGSLSATLTAVASKGVLAFVHSNVLEASKPAVLAYAAWLVVQGVLYAYLPGSTCHGQRTPGGHLLEYTTNGLLAWALTHILYFFSSAAGVLDPAAIAKHWEELFVVVNIYGFLLALAVQLKGHLAPTYPEDLKFSGSWLFDFWSGVELNPRLGKHWDFKFFYNGRPGIVAWTLIDLSWAAYQYQSIGYVTNSMIVVIILHTIYVVDFFYNESWYTRTIDISHDHFGFMLAWGDTTFLPTLYTLQTQYLALEPNQQSDKEATMILCLGLIGYAIFRAANFQRDNFRAKNGSLNVWGKPAEFIKCNYKTSDGREHKTLLLTSGWWGLCRHSNYLGDLIMTFAMCATCGFKHVLPWTYFIYMVILLNHRATRDERRCRNKYGQEWDQYVALVPHRILPGIY